MYTRCLSDVAAGPKAQTEPEDDDEVRGPERRTKNLKRAINRRVTCGMEVSPVFCDLMLVFER